MFNNLEWTKSVLTVAEELRSPIILGCTQGAGKYMTGYKTVVGMVNGMLESMNITVPVALHLDHGSYEHCYTVHRCRIYVHYVRWFFLSN